jgi:hypothetical protein
MAQLLRQPASGKPLSRCGDHIPSCSARKRSQRAKTFSASLIPRPNGLSCWIIFPAKSNSQSVGGKPALRSCPRDPFRSAVARFRNADARAIARSRIRSRSDSGHCRGYLLRARHAAFGLDQNAGHFCGASRGTLPRPDRAARSKARMHRDFDRRRCDPTGSRG